jgi:hypothetical protein
MLSFCYVIQEIRRICEFYEGASVKINLIWLITTFCFSYFATLKMLLTALIRKLLSRRMVFPSNICVCVCVCVCVCICVWIRDCLCSQVFLLLVLIFLVPYGLNSSPLMLLINYKPSVNVYHFFRQGLTLGKQMLYQLSNSLSPIFALVIFRWDFIFLLGDGFREQWS